MLMQSACLAEGEHVMNAIEVRNISKRYGKVSALDNVSFHVGEGEIYGLIGPDGAGKTTLFRILVTLLLPDGGSASVSGMDVVGDYMEIRKHIGYMPGRFSLYQDLSVEENLDFFASVFGTSVADNYDNIKEIYSQISAFSDRRAGKLSGGMKQKLALCCALVHRPAVLFLDEPTTGVDAVSRREFWNMLYRIRSSGVSILVSTPYMDEASKCDRISLIRNGQIIDTGTPDEIVSKYPYRLLSVKGKPVYDLLKFVRGCEGVISCFSFGSQLHAAIDSAVTDADRIMDSIRRKGFEDCSVREIRPGIEDCFMQLSKMKSDGH